MRYSYGGSIADWVFRTVATSEVSDLAQVLGGIEVTFWSARDGGVQYTDLLSVESMPVSSVFTESAGDVGAVGQIPPLFGPEGVTVMWASADGGPRALIKTNDLPIHVHDAAEIVSGVLDPDRLPPGIGGAGDPGTLWVAASNAPAEFADAQYVCDGTADQVQIQAALDEADGRIVQLSPGTFQLSAPVQVRGAGGGPLPLADKSILGYGADVTKLVAAPTISCAIELSQYVAPHLADFEITIEGTTHGIASLPAPPGESMTVQHGTFSNLRITGNYNGTQSGWGLHLEDIYESRLVDIYITGTANGIRFFASNGGLTGNLKLDRASVTLVGSNRKALSVDTTGTRVITDVHVDGFEAWGDSAGTYGIHLNGPAGKTVSHCTVRNANLNWFDRFVSVHGGFNNLFDIGYGELRSTAGNIAFYADTDSWDNTFSLGDSYVGASTVLLSDNNTQNAKAPNRVSMANLVTETGAVVTYTQNSAKTTLLERVSDRGAGTSTSVRRSPLALGPPVVNTLGNSGTSTITLDGLQGSHWRITATGNFTLGNPLNLTDGQMIYLDVAQDATGGRTMTLGTKFRFSATFPNATLTTTTLKKDKLAWQYNAADDKLDLVYFIKGI